MRLHRALKDAGSPLLVQSSDGPISFTPYSAAPVKPNGTDCDENIQKLLYEIEVKRADVKEIKRATYKKPRKEMRDSMISGKTRKMGKLSRCAASLCEAATRELYQKRLCAEQCVAARLQKEREALEVIIDQEQHAPKHCGAVTPFSEHKADLWWQDSDVNANGSNPDEFLQSIIDSVETSNPEKPIQYDDVDWRLPYLVSELYKKMALLRTLEIEAARVPPLEAHLQHLTQYISFNQKSNQNFGKSKRNYYNIS